MKEFVFVGDRCNDHSQNSGYDQICSLFPAAAWLSGRALEAGQIKWHRETKHSNAFSEKVFHVIYADCSGRALPEILRKQHPEATIISSVHKPVSRIQADAAVLSALCYSDAIITVTQVQAREMKEMNLHPKIYSIPHGVWTNSFQPNRLNVNPQRHKVLIVGSFLRDWDGAKKVVNLLSQAGVEIVALGAGARESLTNNPQLTVLPRISEAELVSLYDSAAAVFLPFLEATASNALLEAMAVGCPVICPRFPSLVYEYLGDDADSFEPGCYESAAAHILHYVKNPPEREIRKRYLLLQAKKYDWLQVKKHLAMVYSDIVTQEA